MSSSRLDLTYLPLVSIPTSTSVTGVTSSTASTGVGGVSAPRLNLFANSGYDGTTSVALDNGQNLSLPTLSGDEQAQISALFGGLSTDQQLQLSDASRKLAQALYAQVGYNPQAIQSAVSSTSATTASAAAISGATAASAATAGSASAGTDPAGVGSVSGASSSSRAERKLLQEVAQLLAGTASTVSSADLAANDADDSDDDSDDDNSWASGLQMSVPQQQQLPQSSTQSPVSSLSVGAVSNASTQTSISSLSLGVNAQVKAATVPAGAASSTSGLGSGTASTGVSVSIATPAVVNNINAAGNTYNNATGNADYDKTVQAVSFMGMLGLQGDLNDMANQVQTNVDQQNQTRHDLADVRQAVSSWPADPNTTESFTWTSYDQSGNPVQNTQDLNLSQAQALQSNLEDQLTSQSDMNQEQQLKLQDVTQKYQEAINTISNLLKYEHDTVKAIIQNIHT